METAEEKAAREAAEANGASVIPHPIQVTDARQNNFSPPPSAIIDDSFQEAFGAKIVNSQELLNALIRLLSQHTQSRKFAETVCMATEKRLREIGDTIRHPFVLKSLPQYRDLISQVALKCRPETGWSGDPQFSHPTHSKAFRKKQVAEIFAAASNGDLDGTQSVDSNNA